MLSPFKALLIITMTLGATIASAHGEDKYGPNGGFIQMPGAFHTEVVPIGNDKLNVFLLDINWKNPTTKNSVLEVNLNSGTNKMTKLKCKKSENYFTCDIPNGANLKSGKLDIQATRDGQKGISAVYNLPLKIQKADDDHGGHH